MKKLRKQLIKLLNIHGVSGQETAVRNYLKPIMHNLMDEVIVDDYGNLLSEKKYGTGQGATIMLSAHMDTVRGVLADRELVMDENTITSNVGCLGADDRAGIAIILTILRSMKNINFDGTIKVAFSREEEIGCIGSSKIDVSWYKDVDLALVFDRRGNRDIVVGCGMAFCSNEVGSFMEEVSKMADMNYKCTEGGISDAMTFAENGINAVNLSVGYYNEHTDREYVVVSQMADTTKLVLQALAVVNTFYKGFNEVSEDNNWVAKWSNKYSSSSNYSDWYYEDEYMFDGVEIDEDIWAEQKSRHGDVFIYQVDDTCIISQGENEILLTKDDLSNLFKQLQNN